MSALPELAPNQMCETQEIRCPDCGRFMGLQAICWGSIKLKCPNSRCRQWVTLDINPEVKEEIRRY